MVYIRDGNFKQAIFLERENRFVVFLEYNGRRLRCHLPNPGRMVNLLIEKETILIFEPVPANSNRKTDGTVIAIKQDDIIINLDTMLVSDLIPYFVQNNSLKEFETWKIMEKEKTIGNHRFDFIIQIDDTEVITEVKSTTRVIDNTACFPDAVSKRASDHVKALQRLSENRHKTMIIFTVFQKADRFQPCHEIDPIFAKTFYEGLNHIKVKIFQIEGKWLGQGKIAYSLKGSLPLVEN